MKRNYIAGKPLRDHLEALDHYDPIRLARETTALTESDVRNLHKLVMQRSRPEVSGAYADLPRYVRTETGRHEFPPPGAHERFSAWLKTAPDSPGSAFTAHRGLVSIHPFNDGNGRANRRGREPRPSTPFSTGASMRPWRNSWRSCGPRGQEHPPRSCRMVKHPAT